MANLDVKLNKVVYKKQKCQYIPTSSYRLKFSKSGCGWDTRRGQNMTLGIMTQKQCFERCISESLNTCRNFEITYDKTCILWSG